MPRGITIAALALLGCGASPAPRPDPGTTTTITTSTPPVASASPLPSAGGKPLLFLPILQSDAPLFKDELARVRDAVIARFASASGGRLTPVPDERVAALRAVAKSGKLREDGPVCATPPTGAAAIRAAYPESALGDGALLCSGERCNGSFTVRNERYSESWGTTTPGETIAEMSPVPKNPARVEDWLEAIAADVPAAPAPDPGGMGGVGYGLMLGDGPLTVSWMFRFGFADGASEPDFKPESAVASAKCAFPRMESINVVLAIGGDGVVSRCEGREDDPAIDSECVCKAFAAHRFDASDHERRLRLVVGRSAGAPADPLGGGGSGAGLGGGVKRNGVSVMYRGGPADEPFEAAKPREDALVACFAARKGTASGRTDFTIVSRLDERGGITHTTLRAPKDTLNDAEKKCIGDAAAKFLFTCPEHAGEEVEHLFTARW